MILLIAIVAIVVFVAFYAGSDKDDMNLWQRIVNTLGLAISAIGFAGQIWAVTNCFFIVRVLWGSTAAKVGLICGIVPIIPMSIIAPIWEGEWVKLFSAVGGIVAPYIVMILGGAVSSFARDRGKNQEN